MRTETKTLIEACRILAREIQSDDGVANAALAEIAERMEEMEERRSAEKASSDAYIRIRTMLDAFDTNYGGENRFEVTEAKLKALILSVSEARANAFDEAADMSYENYGTALFAEHLRAKADRIRKGEEK